jgi:hypothetical protein
MRSLSGSLTRTLPWESSDQNPLHPGEVDEPRKYDCGIGVILGVFIPDLGDKMILVFCHLHRDPVRLVCAFWGHKYPYGDMAYIFVSLWGYITIAAWQIFK